MAVCSALVVSPTTAFRILGPGCLPLPKEGPVVDVGFSNLSFAI